MYFCANVTLSYQNHPRSIKRYGFKIRINIPNNLFERRNQSIFVTATYNSFYKKKNMAINHKVKCIYKSLPDKTLKHTAIFYHRHEMHFQK